MDARIVDLDSVETVREVETHKAIGEKVPKYKSFEDDLNIVKFHVIDLIRRYLDVPSQITEGAIDLFLETYQTELKRLKTRKSKKQSEIKNR